MRIKGGAHQAGTGENAVITACRRADVIVGPVGIVIADCLVGEITPAMAVAVGGSLAKRVLIPLNLCDNLIVGVADQPMGKLAQSAVAAVAALDHPVWPSSRKLEAGGTSRCMLAGSPFYFFGCQEGICPHRGQVSFL